MATGLLGGNFHKLYDVEEVAQALSSGGNKQEDLTAYHEKMLRSGGTRLLVSPTSDTCVDAIDVGCQNFHDVSEDIRAAVTLAVDGNEPVSLPPLLLIGKPGIGKTRFARKLAQYLGTGFTVIQMGPMTAGWILGGADAQWRNAKPGKIATTLIDGEVANPVIVVDEVDKTRGDDRYDPFGVLLSLFEHDTAETFLDEYVGVPVDARHILWILTANNTEPIPEPILSRASLYNIRGPTKEEAAYIARTLHQEILAGHKWGAGFSGEVSDNVIESLSHMSPRAMRHELGKAFGRAKRGKRDHLVPEDIRPTESGKMRIGF